MKLSKASQRDRKINRRKHGMVVDSKSVFTIQRVQKERAEQIKKEREEKEKLLEVANEE